MQIEWTKDIVWLLVFNSQALFRAVLILTVHIKTKKTPVCMLAGSDQSHVDALDLVPVSAISVVVRNLMFTESA